IVLSLLRRDGLHRTVLEFDFTAPTGETNKAHIASGIGAEASALVSVLSATPRTSRLAWPLPIAFRQLQRLCFFSPRRLRATVQTRYLPSAPQPGIDDTARPFFAFSPAQNGQRNHVKCST